MGEGDDLADLNRLLGTPPKSELRVYLTQIRKAHSLRE